MGRDGESYAGDLGQKRTKIFLRKGLDSDLLICPTGSEPKGSENRTSAISDTCCEKMA
jgi:hypothetical protein